MPTGVYKRIIGVNFFPERQCFRKGHNYGFQKGHKWPEEKEMIRRRAISEGKTGIKFTEEHKNNLKKNHKGFLGGHHSKESRIKMAISQKGEKSHNWKDGISSINERIRKGIEFRLWREVVFARDNWTCQKYGTKGGILHPHHIQNFADFPELRFAIDNGITLSDKAHREFHKKYGRQNNTKEQIKEFLI